MLRGVSHLLQLNVWRIRDHDIKPFLLVKDLREVHFKIELLAATGDSTDQCTNLVSIFLFFAWSRFVKVKRFDFFKFIEQTVIEKGFLYT